MISPSFDIFNIHISGFNCQPHLSLQTSVWEVAIFMLLHWDLKNIAVQNLGYTFCQKWLEWGKNSPRKKLTENLIDFASPSWASSSIAGPPLLLRSRPSHFAVLSYASPIASSIVVPSCTYWPRSWARISRLCPPKKQRSVYKNHHIAQGHYNHTR